MFGPFVIEATATDMHHATHDVSLVGLSLLVALVGSSATFFLAHTSRKTTGADSRRLLLLCASLVLGSSIWAMHFIGMLAMELPTTVAYNTWLTAASILPSLLASWLALRYLHAPKQSYQRLIVTGSILGAGIAAMHYSGIAALELEGSIYFNLLWFLMSAVSGLLFSICAFALYQELQNQGRFEKQPIWRFVPPVVLTIGIASMHYVSMLGLRKSPTFTPKVSPSAQLAPETLSIVIACVALLVIVLMCLASAIVRYRDLWQGVIARDARLSAMVNTSNDGVITIDDKGIVMDFNPAAQRIFGYGKQEVIGRNISMLMPSPLAEEHDGHLHKHLGQPDKSIGINGREVLGLHRDRRHIPIQLMVGKAQTPQGTIFVGYLQDITERKRTDAQLRIAASVFQHVREGVAIVDANHNISDANPAFLTLMEVGREDIIGRPLDVLYADAESPPDMIKLWSTVATQQYWQDEIMLTRKNKDLWVQRLSISPVLNELNRPHHFIVVVSDVTGRPGLDALMPHADLHDSATNLPAQRLFIDRMSSSLVTARRKSMYLGMVLIHLQPISTPPSQTGAAMDYAGAIRQLTQVLSTQLRATDTVARLQENQIGILLAEIKDADALHNLIQRLVHTLTEAQTVCYPFGIQELHMGYSSTLAPFFSVAELREQAFATLTLLPKPGQASTQEIDARM